MQKNAICSQNAPAAIGPYSQGICVNGIIALSGQLPIDPTVGKIVQGGIREQTEQSLRNVEAILAQADLTVDNIIKTTVYLADIGDFAAMNEVYARHIPAPYPARSAFQVAALPMGALVEIEVLCVRGEIPTADMLPGGACGCGG